VIPKYGSRVRVVALQGSMYDGRLGTVITEDLSDGHVGVQLDVDKVHTVTMFAIGELRVIGEVPTMTLSFLGDEIVQTHAALIEAIGEMKGYAARLMAQGALPELQAMAQRNIETLIVLRDRMEAKL
jgi:hypothetical protein